MNRNMGLTAFGLGLAAVLWVAYGYLGTNTLALTMTALIGAFYLMGALELWRFHAATQSLSAALVAVPGQLSRLGDWLQRIDPSLQNPVRLRIEGERVGLPGPALTPYLVGLLVLLGMLGTFLGMVVTLNGAVLALESTTDLPTIRTALAAPVKGLGLAFGTSVAGVAASAMLGLVSALCRRERLQAAQQLDAQAAGSLRVFSGAHQREATLEALQQQARALPDMLGQMQAWMAQTEKRSADLHERLAAGQDRFHGQAQAAYVELAASVDRSLRTSLTDSAHAAGATIQPAVEATMQAIARETAQLQARMADTLQQTLADWSGNFERQSSALLATVDRAHGALQADAAQADQQRLATWAQTLQATTGTLQQAWQQAGAQALGQQERICLTLEQTAGAMQERAAAHARETIAEVARLMATVSEAPRAAAELIGQLRVQLSDSMVRDNDVLQERSRLMAGLGSLLDGVLLASQEQRAAIDALTSAAAATLEQTGARYTERLDSESTRLAEVAAQLASGAVEVASLGEAFGAAVQLFNDTSASLLVQLQRVGGALDKSSTRSDEQLAYYVAQARELIDLSIAAQQQTVGELQRLARRPAPLAGEPA